MNEDREKELVDKLKALANPLRLRMIARLHAEPKNVYTLAKEMGLSYPLTHLHVKRLRKLELVEEVRRVEQAEGMPSQKFYSPGDFELVISPETILDLYRSSEDERDE